MPDDSLTVPTLEEGRRLDKLIEERGLSIIHKAHQIYFKKLNTAPEEQHLLGIAKRVRGRNRVIIKLSSPAVSEQSQLDSNISVAYGNVPSRKASRAWLRGHIQRRAKILASSEESGYRHMLYVPDWYERYASDLEILLP